MRAVRSFVALVAFLTGIFSAVSATAENAGQSVSQTIGNRVGHTVDQGGLRRLDTGTDSRGWEAVGRLNLGTRGFCTGALIAPDMVLTAAHCLYDPSTGVLIEPAKIEFLAGWRNGRAAAYRGVRRAIAHPAYIYDAEDRLDRVAYDLALIQLDRPIRLPSVQPYQIATDPGHGASVGVVSYAHDRSEAPALQEVCEVLGRQTGVLVMSCNVDFGSSGAPVFHVSNGVARIVSVVSAKAEMTGNKVALGMTLEMPLADLHAAMNAQVSGTARPETAAPGRIDTGSGSGAKFLRP